MKAQARMRPFGLKERIVPRLSRQGTFDLHRGEAHPFAFLQDVILGA